MLSIGDKYLDYIVASYLGRGGMGTVLLLEKEDGEKAALKILHPHLLEDEELVRRFYLEAEVAHRINCPRVCRVFDVRQVSLGVKGSHGILMEFVEGESLAEMMETGDVYGEEWALHVADGVLEGLEAIHAAGLLHRDIKPENIVITPSDTIKLLDLGLAKVIESSIKLSKTGYFIGTYHYASPEQLMGEDIGFSCDIYSLGTVLYEITTGARPHPSTEIRELIHEKVNVPVRRPSRVNPTLSPFFDMLVLDMLEIQPDNRLQTAKTCREIIREREKSDWYRARVSVSISLDSISTSTSLRRMVRVPRRTRLYGRTKEMDQFRSWAYDAIGINRGEEDEEVPNGLSVLIGGEAGIGKTRLVEELVIELESADQPFVVLAGRSLQESRHVPYGPLIEMVRDFFMLENEPDVDLVALFSEYLPNLRPLIPPFLELVTHKRFMDDSDIRGVLNESNLLHLFQTLFTTIAKEVPLILFFDDLQWTDVNTINVLAYLTSGIKGAPLLIVGTFREEELETPEGESHPLVDVLARFARKHEVKRISLDRLDEQACFDIVEECFPNAEFVDELAERVYGKSEGNPFYIMEILNLLYDEGRVGFTDGRWEMRGVTSEIEIPPSLREIVAFRLERLTEQERETLEAASILGYRFSSDLLIDLTDIPRIKLLRVLQKLEKNRRLIVCHEAGYRFDHHVVYETVYDSIIPELRTEYHRFAADLLSDTDEIHPIVYLLVYHLRRSGEDARLLEYLPLACERARDEYSNNLALEHAEWAWEAYDRLGQPETFKPVVTKLLGQRGEVAGLLGERDLELESAVQMLALAEDLNDAHLISLANRLLGEHSRSISEWDEALERYQLALETCPVEKGVECASILRHLGTIEHLRRNEEKAIEYYHKALEALDDLPPSSELVKTHNNLGISLKRVGRIEGAIFEFEQAQQIAEDIGDLYAETFPLGSLALINYDQGKWEKANELFTKHLGILEQTGDMTSLSRTLLNMGNIYYQVGIFDQAEEYFLESLDARRRMEHRLGEAIVLHHLAYINRQRKEYEKAVDRLAEAMTIHEEIGDKRGEATALADLAWIHNLAGRHKIALECASQALELGESAGFADRLVEANMEKLIAKQALGEDRETCSENITKLVAEAGIERFIQHGPWALLRLAVLQEQCGLDEESSESRKHAKELAEKNLSQLNDPEWCASYRLLYQEILQ